MIVKLNNRYVNAYQILEVRKGQQHVFKYKDTDYVIIQLMNGERIILYVQNSIYNNIDDLFDGTVRKINEALKK